MGDKIRIQVVVRTNAIGSKCTKTIEFDRQGWNEMDEDERNEIVEDQALKMVEWDWYEADD